MLLRLPPALLALPVHQDLLDNQARTAGLARVESRAQTVSPAKRLLAHAAFQLSHPVRNARLDRPDPTVPQDHQAISAHQDRPALQARTDSPESLVREAHPALRAHREWTVHPVSQALPLPIRLSCLDRLANQEIRDRRAPSDLQVFQATTDHQDLQERRDRQAFPVRRVYQVNPDRQAHQVSRDHKANRAFARLTAPPTAASSSSIRPATPAEDPSHRIKKCTLVDLFLLLVHSALFTNIFVYNF